MPEAIVSGLTGTEIIEDFLNHLRTKLRRDCNLRDSDSYSRGYSATGSFKIKLYGMDETPVDGEVAIGFDDPAETEKVETEVNVEIEQELELNAVRERAGLEEPVLSVNSEGRPEIKKRKYTKRIVSEAAPEPTIGGGAEEFTEF
jgi:hypothetical protein